MWQPIETAPKDETSVLIWTGYEAAVAYYGENMLADDGSVCWMNAYIDEPLFKGEQPTHWMPLPNPPA